MNLLHLIDRTELKLEQVKSAIKYQTVLVGESKNSDNWISRKKLALDNLKDEKEYLCDILTLLFKELETPTKSIK